MQAEPIDSRFLACLPHRHGLTRGLPSIGVTSRLEPAVQPAMVDEKDPISPSGDDNGAPGDMAFHDRPIEGVGMEREKSQNPAQAFRLGIVDGGVAGQRLGESHGRF